MQHDIWIFFNNTEGILITESGFRATQYAAYVILPMPPEPVGDGDNDAVLDDVDECPTTPEGEPSCSTGCSDSETDDDGDNVINNQRLMRLLRWGNPS